MSRFITPSLSALSENQTVKVERIGAIFMGTSVSAGLPPATGFQTGPCRPFSYRHEQVQTAVPKTALNPDGSPEDAEYQNPAGTRRVLLDQQPPSHLLPAFGG